MKLVPRQPIHFVCRDSARWPELLCGAAVAPGLFTASVVDRFRTNEDCWVTQTYLQLKDAGEPVSISSSFLPDTVCVASTLDFGIRDRTFDSFVVGCRSDGFEPALADVTIVQNKGMVQRSTDVFIPHWPQPGLIGREVARQTQIEQMAFKGSEVNLYESFRSSDFLRRLSDLGVFFEVNGLPEAGLVRWRDYRCDDLVMAARDLTVEDAKVKPASKLVNAWFAGVPALLGPEPAFRELRTSDLDYIEVRTPDDVLNAVTFLRANPERYRAMIENGLRRAQAFTPQRIRSRWIDVLQGSVAEEFARWRKTPRSQRLARFGISCLHHKINIRRSKRNRDHGLRLLSGVHS
jgi:hypothetical protein